MNEVYKINLGRQVFTIAADAKRELHDYLESIRRLVSDKSVVDEVEIRMAELLIEQGVGPRKVVLRKDVDFLKEQLGSPADFKDDDDAPAGDSPEAKITGSRRLFRDTDNAILAGVSAGLARYFGLDVLLIRIVFVILLVVTAGWAILLYILLWILVPEAKSASDRLQMAGKPVNIEGLKQVTQSMDVKGAARRANASLAGPINRIFSVCLKLAGIVLTAFGLGLIFSLIGGLVYFLANGTAWSRYNLFPIGVSQHVLLYVSAGVVALVAIFITLFGVATFRRRWPVPAWVTGILLGLLLLGLAVSGALTASVYPAVRSVYYANIHQTTRPLPPFDSVNYAGDGIWNVNFEHADSYYVTISTFSRPDVTPIKTTVNNKTLTINTSGFYQRRDCPVLCVPDNYNVSLTIHSPNFSQLQNQFQNDNPPVPPDPKVIPEPAGQPLGP